MGYSPCKDLLGPQWDSALTALWVMRRASERPVAIGLACHGFSKHTACAMGAYKHGVLEVVALSSPHVACSGLYSRGDLGEGGTHSGPCQFPLAH